MKSLKCWIAVAAAALLSGCVTWDQVDAGLKSLRGKSLSEVVSIIGYPDSEVTIDGRKIYTWGNQVSGTYSVPTTSTATTYVGGQPVYSTIYGSQTQSYNYNCTVRIAFSRGKAIDVQYSGNLGGCERYGALAPEKIR